jgi:aminoglycoside/choline kinase family phosphotransferase
MVVELINQTLSRFPRFAQQQIVVRPLEKGGSDRNFYRIAVGDQASLILAKYGQQREENRHYVDIARFLAGIGVRVPQIYFHDESEGLIWMEDLGERDLWSYRHDSWDVRQVFYQDAIDQIVTLHSRAHIAHNGEAPKLQAGFDAQLYLWEQNYFVENCLHRSFHLETTALDDLGIRAQLREIAEQLAALPRCFVHRDFQSQNIVIKEGRACFIDFQGMRPGLPHYDLASLLYDPYVALTTLERDALLRHYLAGCEDLGAEAPANFNEILDLCAMQRLMQALGAYGFLGLVKGRTHFLEHIPTALTNLCEVAGRIRGLDGLGRLLADLGPLGQAREASPIP